MGFYKPPFMKLSLPRGGKPLHGQSYTNIPFIKAKYEKLDNFQIAGNVKDFADTFLPDGTFTIAQSTSTGPDDIKTAIDNFFAILEPGGISHESLDMQEKGRVVNSYARVTYNVLNDPEPIVLYANTRIVTVQVQGVRYWKDMHVQFDLPPQILFEAFDAANP